MTNNATVAMPPAFGAAPQVPMTAPPAVAPNIGSGAPVPSAPGVPMSTQLNAGGGTFGAVPAINVPMMVSAPTYGSPLSTWFSSMLGIGFSNKVAPAVPAFSPAMQADSGADIGKLSQQLACTADAMTCPDGTGVGRSGPDCSFDCTGHGGNPIAPAQTTAPVPAIATPSVPCGAATIKCANGTVILPGPDCAYHFSCADFGNNRGGEAPQPAIQGMVGVDATVPQALSAGPANNTFAVAPQTAMTSDGSFGNRFSALMQGVLGIGSWFGQFLR